MSLTWVWAGAQRDQTLAPGFQLCCSLPPARLRVVSETWGADGGLDGDGGDETQWPLIQGHCWQLGALPQAWPVWLLPGKEGPAEASQWHEGPAAELRPELDPRRAGAVCCPGCVPPDHLCLNRLESRPMCVWRGGEWTSAL